MKKVYNDNSDKFADWTTAKLKKELVSLYEAIYGEASCYGKRELMEYDGVLNELSERNVSLNYQISFN